MADKDILADAKAHFELCVDAETTNRLNFIEDLRFVWQPDKYQWPDKVRAQREKDGRPCLTVSKMLPFTQQVINDARLNKPQIKVRPVDDVADVRTAKVMNGLIRNIEQSSNADIAYDTAMEFAVTGGWGYFRITTEYAHDDTFDQDIRIERVANPLSVFADPYSTAADSSDWNIGFITDRLPKKVFEDRYKGAEPVDWNDYAGGTADHPWLNDDGVLVAEYWKREEIERTIVLLSNGIVLSSETYEADKDLYDQQNVTVEEERPVLSHKVRHLVMTGAEVLKDEKWAGRYIPIIPVYGREVNIEGERFFYSLIRDAKDPQRMFNFWRTASTELVALAPRVPFIGEEGFTNAPGMAERWNSINNVSWPFVEYKRGSQPPQRQPLDAGPAIGAMQESLAASDDMKAVIGIYDASLGAKSNETSGKAIMARQREGDVGTFHFSDNLNRAIRHAGRILLDLIPAVYSRKRIIRTLGEDGTAETVPINQPVLMGPKGEASPLPQMTPGMPEPEMGTELEQGIVGIYDLTAGKYDLVVDSGPSFTTRREEAATQMVELLRAFPQAAPYIGDLLAKNLDWPGAEEIAERLRMLLPPELRGDQGQENPLIQEGVKIIQGLQAKLQEMEQDKSLEQSKLDVDREKVDVERYKAESERYKMQLDVQAMTPEQVQAVVVQTMKDLFNGNPPVSGGQAPPVPPPPVMARPQPQPAPAGSFMPGGM